MKELEKVFSRRKRRKIYKHILKEFKDGRGLYLCTALDTICRLMYNEGNISKRVWKDVELYVSIHYDKDNSILDFFPDVYVNKQGIKSSSSYIWFMTKDRSSRIRVLEEAIKSLRLKMSKLFNKKES